MDVIVRRLQDSDLEEADKILRLSFGTFMGLADPMTCFGVADYVKTRFHADPDLTIVAEVNGRLLGFNFIANWGVLDFLIHCAYILSFGIKELQIYFLVPRWICSKNEYKICWGCLRLLIVQNIFIFTKNMDFGRDFLLP